MAPPARVAAPRGVTADRVVSPRVAESDGELLSLFTRHKDRAALDRLIDRHAPMVWRVCRQSLRRPQDAEDAFQATFLLLVKSARQIGASDSAAGWLYRVAYRTSLRARKKLAARREESLALDPLAPPEEEFPDLLRKQSTGVLVEELMRLPDKYQTPLVMRYLEGQSRRAIADQTDTTIASVQGRLARGKQLLRSQLLRRGVSLSAAMAAATAKPGVAEASPAQAPAVVVAQTVSNSAALAAGGSLAASTAVVSLYREGMRAMFTASIAKPAAAGVLAITLAALALGGNGAGAADGGGPTGLVLSAEAPDVAPEAEGPIAIQVRAARPAANHAEQPSRVEEKRAVAAALSTRDKLLDVLSYIPSVKVQVNERRDDAAKAVEADAVVVVPMAYVEAVHRKRVGSDETIDKTKQQLESQVEAIVQPLLPRPSLGENERKHVRVAFADEIEAAGADQSSEAPRASAASLSAAPAPPQPVEPATRSLLEGHLRRLKQLYGRQQEEFNQVDKKGRAELVQEFKRGESERVRVFRNLHASIEQIQNQLRQLDLKESQQAVAEAQKQLGLAPGAPALAETKGQPTASRRRESSVQPTADTPPANAEGAPVVVATVPERGATDVDPGLKEVRVTFDRDMGRGMSWTGDKESGMPPVAGGQSAKWIDKRTCVLHLGKLEPGREYRLGINAPSYKNFKAVDGAPAVIDELRFTTSVSNRKDSHEEGSLDNASTPKELRREQDPRAARNECLNHLKDLALAFHNYHDQHEHLPAPAETDGSRPTLSWRVTMLPLLGHQELYDAFRHDEAWDSPHNLKLLPRMPEVFSDPRGALPPESGRTHYLAAVGPHAFMKPGATRRFREFRDGSAHTIALLAVDDAHAVEWTRPADFDTVTHATAPRKGMGEFGRNDYLAAYVDGHVKELDPKSPSTVIASQLLIDDLNPPGGQRFAGGSSDRYGGGFVAESGNHVAAAGESTANLQQQLQAAQRQLREQQRHLEELVRRLQEQKAAQQNEWRGASTPWDSAFDKDPFAPQPSAILLPPDGGAPGQYAERNREYGWSVKQLQRRLNEVLRPSPRLDVDGDYGPQTERAVKRLQIERGLPPTGLADKTTRTAAGLVEPVTAAPPGIPLQASQPEGDDIAYGQRNRAYGWSVSQLQQRLNEVLNPSPGLDVDGDYGPLTDRAVRRFQSERGIPPTGQADAATRAALGFVEPGRELAAPFAPQAPAAIQPPVWGPVPKAPPTPVAPKAAEPTAALPPQAPEEPVSPGTHPKVPAVESPLEAEVDGMLLRAELQLLRLVKIAKQAAVVRKMKTDADMNKVEIFNSTINRAMYQSARRQASTVKSQLKQAEERLSEAVQEQVDAALAHKDWDFAVVAQQLHQSISAMSIRVNELERLTDAALLSFQQIGSENVDSQKIETFNVEAMEERLRERWEMRSNKTTGDVPAKQPQRLTRFIEQMFDNPGDPQLSDEQVVTLRERLRIDDPQLSERDALQRLVMFGMTYGAPGLKNLPIEARFERALQVAAKAPSAPQPPKLPSRPTTPEPTARPKPAKPIAPPAFGLPDESIYLSQLRGSETYQAAPGDLPVEFETRLLKLVDDRASHARRRREPVRFVVGRLAVDDEDDPQTVTAQMKILPGGYFFDELDDLTEPIGFRKHGYLPQDITVGRTTNLVIDLGEVPLQRTPETERRTLLGEVKLADGEDPSGAKVALRVAHGPINNYSNGYEPGSKSAPRLPVALNASGQWEAAGLSPIEYYVDFTAGGYLRQWRKIDLADAENERLAPVTLERPRKVRLRYATEPYERRGQMPPLPTPALLKHAQDDARTTEVVAGEGFRSDPQRTQYGWDFQVKQEEGEVGFHFTYAPCRIVDLGAVRLEDVERLPDLPLHQVRLDAPALREGHTYLLDQQAWRHYVLFRVERVSPPEGEAAGDAEQAEAPPATDEAAETPEPAPDGASRPGLDSATDDPSETMLEK